MKHGRSRGVGLFVALGALVACGASQGAAPVAAQPDPAASALPGQPSAVASSSAAPPAASTAAPAAASASASSAVASSASPPALDPSRDATDDRSFASWTEKNAIDALATSCAAGPPATADDTPSSLACKLPFEQSCVYDPCFEREQKCRQGCGATCGSCDKQCVSSCSACASRCKDDACRRACATTTGACKQACLEKLDSCASATCAAQVKGCGDAEARKWKAQGCTGKCGTWNECFSKCNEAYGSCSQECGGKGEGESCAKKCEDRRGGCIRSCNARIAPCDAGYCVSGMGPGE